jgi:hypothetical protein
MLELEFPSHQVSKQVRLDKEIGPKGVLRRGAHDKEAQRYTVKVNQNYIGLDRHCKSQYSELWKCIRMEHFRHLGLVVLNTSIHNFLSI